jgi:hypothetical protein
MATHAVPKNLGKVEKKWKGVPNRYIYTVIAVVIISGALMLCFFDAQALILQIFIMLLWIAVLFSWFLYARTPKKLDESKRNLLFAINGIRGKNIKPKYAMTDSSISKLLTINKFHQDGTIEFSKGFGWIYAYDPDLVNKDDFTSYSTKTQALLNSLPENMFLKLEVRIEPRLDAQKLTEKTNDLINAEKSNAKLAHLKSVYEFSKEKETHDYERRYYIFVGLNGNRSIEEARIMKEKIEHGLKDKINHLNVLFNQIKNPYTLFEFYAGELR